jgi:methylase of polypeptide subunit release factors
MASNSRQFDETGIPIYRVTGGYPISEAIHDHPDLIPYLRSQNPPRINNLNREALLHYNYYIAKEKFGLDIEFEADQAIIPTPMMRYAFLKHILFEGAKIVEIGTGASAIIAMLAAKIFKAQVIATEMDPEYLQIASRNIRNNGLENQIQLIDSQGKFLDGVISADEQPDFIISNPPYYDIVRSPKLLWGGKSHELVGQGDAGEQFIVSMIEQGKKYMKPSGIISFIIPKTRQDTLVEIEAYLNQQNYDFDIFGLKAGNRTRFVFRLYHGIHAQNSPHSEMD